MILTTAKEQDSARDYPQCHFSRAPGRSACLIEAVTLVVGRGAVRCPLGMPANGWRDGLTKD
jgi:hypothetical protein